MNTDDLWTAQGLGVLTDTPPFLTVKEIHVSFDSPQICLITDYGPEALPITWRVSEHILCMLSVLHTVYDLQENKLESRPC